MAAGVAHERARTEVVALAERGGVDGAEPVDIHAVGHDFDRCVDADGLTDVLARALTRGDDDGGVVEKPPLVAPGTPANRLLDSAVDRDVLGVLGCRRVIRGDQRERLCAGQTQAADADAERGVGVDDVDVTGSVGQGRHADAKALVKRERQTPDGVLARSGCPLVRLWIDEVHPAATRFPALPPGLDSVGHTVDRREVGVGERGDAGQAHRPDVTPRALKSL